jgi:LytS/YehU family sensor histidine kinase
MIDMHVKGNANGHTILPLLLIQFVENAFKHGMKEKSEQSWMRVNITIEDNELHFLANNSCHTPAITEGVGFSSVKHRLNLQYEGKYEMTIKNENEEFAIFLKLNLS